MKVALLYNFRYKTWFTDISRLQFTLKSHKGIPYDYSICNEIMIVDTKISGKFNIKIR